MREVKASQIYIPSCFDALHSAHALSSKYQSVLFFEAAQYSLVIREAKPIEGALDQELT
jgi:hypothetical protein